MGRVVGWSLSCACDSGTGGKTDAGNLIPLEIINDVLQVVRRLERGIWIGLPLRATKIREGGKEGKEEDKEEGRGRREGRREGEEGEEGGKGKGREGGGRREGRRGREGKEGGREGKEYDNQNILDKVY